MNKDAVLILNGWLKLNAEQQDLVAEEIHKFKKSNLQERKSMVESITGKTAHIILGPTGTPCRCCGR